MHSCLLMRWTARFLCAPTRRLEHSGLSAPRPALKVCGSTTCGTTSRRGSSRRGSTHEPLLVDSAIGIRARHSTCTATSYPNRMKRRRQLWRRCSRVPWMNESNGDAEIRRRLSLRGATLSVPYAKMKGEVRRAETRKDIRFEVPLYTVAEAARALAVPTSTFSTWARGYD